MLFVVSKSALYYISLILDSLLTSSSPIIPYSVAVLPNVYNIFCLLLGYLSASVSCYLFIAACLMLSFLIVPGLLCFLVTNFIRNITFFDVLSHSSSPYALTLELFLSWRIFRGHQGSKYGGYEFNISDVLYLDLTLLQLVLVGSLYLIFPVWSFVFFSTPTILGLELGSFPFPMRHLYCVIFVFSISFPCLGTSHS